MSEMTSASVGNGDPAQARELAVLVELEARWENLRKAPRRDAAGRLTLLDLLGIQNAYTAFRTKLTAYNKRYKPAHAAELLLNTPARMAAWCRAMRDVYLQVEQDSPGLCPVHLLEKAYRCADRLGVVMNKGAASRSTSPATVGDAIRELEALGQWCDSLTIRAISA